MTVSLSVVNKFSDVH